MHHVGCMACPELHVVQGAKNYAPRPEPYQVQD